MRQASDYISVYSPVIEEGGPVVFRAIRKGESLSGPHDEVSSKIAHEIWDRACLMQVIDTIEMGKK